MIIIDRFEGEYAVIEDNGIMVTVLRTELPGNVREGSVLIKSGNTYTVDISATNARTNSIKNRFDSLKKNR